MLRENEMNVTVLTLVLQTLEIAGNASKIDYLRLRRSLETLPADHPREN